MVGAMKPGGSLQPNGERIQEPVMPVEHVADAIVHMASLPLSVNILNQVRSAPFLPLSPRNSRCRGLQTIMATAMPFVGRG
jgi:hypothetical protein